MEKNIIVLFGGSGLAGYAISSHLSQFHTVYAPTRKECDLFNKGAIDSYLRSKKPSLVINCAGLVGGILYNHNDSSNFLIQNLDIGINVAKSCFENKIYNYIYFGSNCLYPKNACIPINENQILSGKLEKTNISYALSKIISIQYLASLNQKFNTNYFSIMPPNLYGENDFYNLDKSHVLQSLILKIHNAKLKNEKEVIIWGSGNPKREFLHTKDLAKGVAFLISNIDILMKIVRKNDLPIINIGTQKDIKISELGYIIAREINWNGNFTYDRTKPDGTTRKLLDCRLINELGWNSTISLEMGIKEAYDIFRAGNYRS